MENLAVPTPFKENREPENYLSRPRPSMETCPPPRPYSPVIMIPTKYANPISITAPIYQGSRTTFPTPLIRIVTPLLPSTTLLDTQTVPTSTQSPLTSIPTAVSVSTVPPTSTTTPHPSISISDVLTSPSQPAPLPSLVSSNPVTTSRSQSTPGPDPHSSLSPATLASIAPLVLPVSTVVPHEEPTPSSQPSSNPSSTEISIPIPSAKKRRRTAQSSRLLDRESESSSSSDSSYHPPYSRKSQKLSRLNKKKKSQKIVPSRSRRKRRTPQSTTPPPRSLTTTPHPPVVPSRLEHLQALIAGLREKKQTMEKDYKREVGRKESGVLRAGCVMPCTMEESAERYRQHLEEIATIEKAIARHEKILPMMQPLQPAAPTSPQPQDEIVEPDSISQAPDNTEILDAISDPTNDETEKDLKEVDAQERPDSPLDVSNVRVASPQSVTMEDNMEPVTIASSQNSPQISDDGLAETSIQDEVHKEQRDLQQLQPGSSPEVFPSDEVKPPHPIILAIQPVKVEDDEMVKKEEEASTANETETTSRTDTSDGNVVGEACARRRKRKTLRGPNRVWTFIKIKKIAVVEASRYYATRFVLFNTNVTAKFKLQEGIFGDIPQKLQEKKLRCPDGVFTLTQLAIGRVAGVVLLIVCKCVERAFYGNLCDEEEIEYGEIDRNAEMHEDLAKQVLKLLESMWSKEFALYTLTRGKTFCNIDEIKYKCFYKLRHLVCDLEARPAQRIPEYSVHHTFPHPAVEAQARERPNPSPALLSILSDCETSLEELHALLKKKMEEVDELAKVFMPDVMDCPRSEMNSVESSICLSRTTEATQFCLSLRRRKFDERFKQGRLVKW